MNLGQITSLTQCFKCGNYLEIYPSQENVKCNICDNLIDLRMRDFTKEESEAYQKGLESMSKPTGINFYSIEDCHLNLPIILEEIKHLYRAYGLEDDNNLTKDAQLLKNQILNFVGEIKNL
jgi:hypothetical protein